MPHTDNSCLKSIGARKHQIEQFTFSIFNKSP